MRGAKIAAMITTSVRVTSTTTPVRLESTRNLRSVDSTNGAPEKQCTTGETRPTVRLGGGGGWQKLMCRGPLNVELIAARPSCFSLYKQGGARSTGFASPVHPTHPFLTDFTSKDFLHVSSLTRNPIWRSPSSILSVQTPC